MSASASKKKRKVLEEQGVSAKDIAAKNAREQKNKLLRNVGIVALAALVCLAAVFAVIKLVNKPSYDTEAPVLSAGDQNISVPVYDYLYNLSASNFYNNYSFLIQTGVPVSQQQSYFGDGSLEDYLKQSTNESLKELLNVVSEAKAKGFSLSDEEQASIKTELENVKTQAASYGWSNVDKYLAARFGEGCDLDNYEQYLELVALYTAYSNKLSEEFKPTAEELKAKYDADPSAFDLVSFRYATSAASSTQVESGEKVTDPTAPTQTTYTDEAIAAAKEKAEGFLTEMPEDTKTLTYSKSQVESSYPKEVAEWLFDASRKEGERKVFARDEKQTYFYTVEFSSRETNDYCLVNAQLLTIAKDKQTDTDASKEAQTGEEKQDEAPQQSAQEKFEAVKAAIQDGMSDEDFNKALSGLGYTANSSSYSKTYSVQQIKDFLFDGSRKAGDLLTSYETDDSYFIVRYVSTQEDTYRNSLVKSALWNEFYEAIAEANELSVDEELLQHANTDLTFNASTSSGSETSAS